MSDTKPMKPIVIDVINCARCGNDHSGMKFWKFEGNPIADTDGTIWEYWSTCPKTDEPVLMKVEKG